MDITGCVVGGSYFEPSYPLTFISFNQRRLLNWTIYSTGNQNSFLGIKPDNCSNHARLVGYDPSKMEPAILKVKICLKPCETLLIKRWQITTNHTTNNSEESIPRHSKQYDIKETWAKKLLSINMKEKKILEPFMGTHEGIIKHSAILG